MLQIEILRCGVSSLTLSGKPKRILLVDCNNFFVSCERVFNPSLIGKPVVVLSSNDGCIIARSQEAKDLNIPMGAPAFEYEAFFKKYNVSVYSSNFSLYGDMSARVMQVLAHEATDIEVYSVDEAFLHIVDYGHEQDDAYYARRAQEIIKKVKQYTGIPISIGIAPTKTLAKIANKIAKKNSYLGGYFDITRYAHIDILLQKISVADIWGVGRRYARMLINNNIINAYQLKYAADDWVRSKMTINGLKMVHELRGIPCYKVDEIVSPNKSFVVSRSFGKSITSKLHLERAVSGHAVSAARKLRKQQLIASHISVFVLLRFHQDTQRLYESVSHLLPEPSSYTPDIINGAKICIDRLYKPGIIYKKIGIVLSNIVSAASRQMTINGLSINREKQKEAMDAVDAITARWGYDKLTFAAEGFDKPWAAKKEKKSPHFTTSWHELLEI